MQSRSGDFQSPHAEGIQSRSGDFQSPHAEGIVRLIENPVQPNLSHAEGVGRLIGHGTTKQNLQLESTKQHLAPHLQRGIGVSRATFSIKRTISSIWTGVIYKITGG
ncbi:MAG: hypothetical protein FWG98_09720 [Candidatus Cloacimonetes bacterium]|nr:hypothetical protein [Candidatus Cloacimonadota bacterium]